MRNKLRCIFPFVFVFLLVSKGICTETSMLNLDLFQTGSYFSKCEIQFYNFNFLNTHTDKDYLTSLNRPLLISNETNTATKFYNSRYQLVRCKTIITVEDNNAQTMINYLDLHAFKESNYFIIFNLTLKFTNTGILAKFNSFIHVLIHSPSPTDSYQGYDYIQECNCLKLTHVPFGNFIPVSEKLRRNFNNQIVYAGTVYGRERIGTNCPEWYINSCPVQSRIIEIQRKYFNFTPHFKQDSKLNKFFRDSRLYEKDIHTYISDNAFYDWHRNYTNDSLQYFYSSTESYTLAYCEDKFKFTIPSFQYWISPFQLSVWIFVVAGIFVTSVVSFIASNSNSKSLQFAFFIHVSFFLRQSSPDRISLLQAGVFLLLL